MASRNCRFASKYCRIAGVAPAGSEETGGEAISGERLGVSITLGSTGFFEVLLGSTGFALIILALDTTTRGGSIAVVHDGVVRVEHDGDPAVFSGQRLPSELDTV